MALTLNQIQELVELGEVIQHQGGYYFAYYAEVNNIDGQIQCDQCHDTFKAPWLMFFNVLKKEVMYRCPNGCESKRELEATEP